jgi:hypothetical protein
MLCFDICNGISCGEGKQINGGQYLCPHNNLEFLYPDLASEWDPHNKNTRGLRLHYHIL